MDDKRSQCYQNAQACDKKYEYQFKFVRLTDSLFKHLKITYLRCLARKLHLEMYVPIALYLPENYLLVFKTGKYF